MNPNELQPHPTNSVIYGNESVNAKLSGSVKAKGILTPLLITHGNVIISGHTRWRVAMALGMTDVPVSYFASSDEDDILDALIDANIQRQKTNWQQAQEVSVKWALEERRAAQRMEEGRNQHSPTPIQAEASNSQTGETREIVAANFGMGKNRAAQLNAIATAIDAADEEEKRELIKKLNKGSAARMHNFIKRKKEEKEKEKAVEDVEEMQTETAQRQEVKGGDVWQLGDHILYCGDTSGDEFRKLCKPCTFAFADPPYGAGVDGFDDNEFYWQHDFLIDYADVVAVTPGIVSIFKFAKITAMPYSWSTATWITNGMTRGALGFGNWMYTGIFSRESIHRNAQDFSKVSIKTSDNGLTKHKGRKPSGYMAWVVDLFTDKGDLIIDPFAGSGQTLLIAESMGRKCITGEIIPASCDDIITRWESMTLGEAVKI